MADEICADCGDEMTEAERCVECRDEYGMSLCYSCCDGRDSY